MHIVQKIIIEQRNKISLDFIKESLTLANQLCEKNEQPLSVSRTITIRQNIFSENTSPCLQVIARLSYRTVTDNIDITMQNLLKNISMADERLSVSG